MKLLKYLSADNDMAKALLNLLLYVSCPSGLYPSVMTPLLSYKGLFPKIMVMGCHRHLLEGEALCPGRKYE